MKKNPFRVLGADVPPLVGRRDLVARIESHLDKASPDHLSVVGPAMYGKSVLLKEIAGRYAPGRPGYITSAYVELRRRTPETDDELRLRVAEKLREALAETWPELADLLGFEDVAIAERLQLVGRELATRDEAVLMVLDGFDDVLANAGITREIWDNLLEIAGLPVYRFLTGSRRPLRELCRDEESRTSDFWEIFHDAPVVVGCFDDEDWAELVAPFETVGMTLDDKARKEIEQWTGSIPVLSTAFLQSLWENTEEGGTIGSTEVEATGERVLERRRQLLTALWEDCSAEAKTDLADLTRRELRVRELPAERLDRLERRGLVRSEGKRVVFACRLMERYATQEATGVTSLQRLFGDHELFEQNVRMLLEMRLSQLPMADKALHGYIEQAIRHLQPEPRHALVWMRSIVDRAFELVWEAELKDGVTLPTSWMEEWERAGIQRMPDDGHGRVPGERGRQLHLLRLATGTGVGGRTVRRLTRRVSKPTALLLEHLQSVGNFGQHQGDEVTRPFAVSVCLSAIALYASLAEDLSA